MKTSDSRDKKVEKRRNKRRQWKGGGKGWIGALHNSTHAPKPQPKKRGK